MPAEKIFARRMPGQEDPDAPCVRVAWGVDHAEVVLASALDRERGADAVLAMVNGWLAAAGLSPLPGRDELAALVAQNADPDGLVAQFGVGFEGFHTTLGHRHDINRLIQLLKRARDGAFGRDE